MRSWLRSKRPEVSHKIVAPLSPIGESYGSSHFFFNPNGSPRELSVYGSVMEALSPMIRRSDSLVGSHITTSDLVDIFHASDIEALAGRRVAYSVDNEVWNRQARVDGNEFTAVATENDTGRRMITRLGLKDGKTRVISLRASLEPGSIGVADLHREGNSATVVQAIVTPSGQWHTFYAVVGQNGVRDSFYYGSRDPHPDGALLFDMPPQARKDEIMRMARRRRQVESH